MTTETQQRDEPKRERVRCPFCGSDATESQAMFGSMQLTTQHYCRTCRSVFERIRDDEPDEG
jgi:DNA-directed RNA polymerase subunit RPC12/RpoP